MPRSLPLSPGLTLLLTLLVAGCSSESEIAGPHPGPDGPPSQLLGSALQLRVDVKAGTVTLERPAHRGATKDDGIRPSFALLGQNEIGASVSNIVRTSLPLLRTRIRFDLSLTNKLLHSKLVASTFPDPPTGVAQVVAFPFATEPAGLFGLRVRPSTDWNGTGASGSGAPHNFFNDAACALPGPTSDCFRWEAYGAALGPGQSATRAVGFDVDPFVSTFTVMWW